MSYVTSDSEGGMLSTDQSNISLVDNGSCGGSKNIGFLLKKGPWTSSEDAILVEYVKKHGEGNWNVVQKHSGLFRCGKSCRLRWANHLRPNLKKGAFTSEEEQLIVELHAKMGNKWALMAAHLPGRTDNEIKNYWNTRVQRRRRAGLPLYPPEACLQTFQENQQIQNAGEIHNGDIGNILQNGDDIPEVVFASLETNQGALPYLTENCDFSASGMLMYGLTSQYDTFVPPAIHRLKRLRKLAAPLSGYNSHVLSNISSLNSTRNDSCPTRISQSLDFLYPCESFPITQNLLTLGVNHYQGGQSLLNGNFSASQSTPVAVKLGLPSLQFLETDFCSWASSSPPVLESVDAFIQSPPASGPLQSDFCSLQNSGLLDALLHQAQTMSTTKNTSSEKTSNLSTVTPDNTAGSSDSHNFSEEMKDEGDPPVLPLGNSTTASGSLSEETSPAETFPGVNVKPEPVEQAWTCDAEMKGLSTHMDFLRPDALLGSLWLEQSVACTKEQDIMTDAITAILGDDSGSSDFKCMSADAHIISSRGGSFGSCTWNIMPAVCEMSEFP